MKPSSKLLKNAGIIWLILGGIAILGFFVSVLTGNQANHWGKDAQDLFFKGLVLLGIAEIINRLPKAEK